MHKVEPTRGRPQGIVCPNCDKPMRATHEFETILLCTICFDIADRLVENCRRDLEKTLDVYKRILVAAAMEKKLHLQNAEAATKAPVYNPV